jgi:hypothetical protein
MADADEFSPLAERAQYYREIAAAIRARLASMQSGAAREDLSALATDYELLAKFVESCRAPEGTRD